MPGSRRFEFVEGTSSKFWEIALEGTCVRTTYGRIGANGQTTLKDSPDAAAAQKLFDKLVKEKTGKGYVEVGEGRSACAAPAVAPKAKGGGQVEVEPAAEPPPAAPKAQKRFDFAILEERVAPREPYAFPPEVLSLARIKEGFEDTSDHREGAPYAPALRKALGGWKKLRLHDWAERLLDTWAKGVVPKQPDVQADALFACCCSTLGCGGAAVRQLFDVFGPGHLAEVVLAAAEFNLPFYGDELVVHDPAPAHWNNPPVFVTEAVRSALAAPERAQVRKAGERARKQAPLVRRALLTAAVQDPDWAAADAREILAVATDDYWYQRAVEQLGPSIGSIDLLVELARRFPESLPLDPVIDAQGLKALPVLLASMDRYDVVPFATRLECPAMARALVGRLGERDAAKEVKEYFARRPDLAMVALAPVAAESSKLANLARPLLAKAAASFPSVPQEILDALEPRARALVASERDAKPAEVAPAREIPPGLSAPLPPPARGKVTSLPGFADPSLLPPVVLASGRALPQEAVANLLEALRRSTLAEPHPAVLELKKAAQPERLSAFAWSLFEAWLAGSGASKEGWAFTALGLLGDDAAARKLTPLIRGWPGESQHARAVTGLEVLAAIGTDVALMNLNGVAEKVKFKGLQEKARAKIADLAAARGLAPEELADRLAPDLGLDSGGATVLDFGPRAFKVGFDEQLRPYVLDPSGKQLADLPKPGKGDDAEKAAAAVERFKLLKKDARAIASTQIARLELAMCSQRRFTPESFRLFLVEHPLLVHVVRRLVWGVFVGERLTATFRVAEDRTYASPEDEPYQLPAKARVGLVHRLELGEEAVTQWARLFADYELLQPFDQLGRATFAPQKGEAKASSLHRLTVEVPTSKIRGLEARGWRKGPPQDAGWVWEILKPLPDGMQARLALEGGLCMGWVEGTPTRQKVGALSLGKEGGKATFAELSPTVFSELVRDVEQLRE